MYAVCMHVPECVRKSNTTSLAGPLLLVGDLPLNEETRAAARDHILPAFERLSSMALQCPCRIDREADIVGYAAISLPCYYKGSKYTGLCARLP